MGLLKKLKEVFKSRDPIVEDRLLKCDVCGKTNTEFTIFKGKYDLKDVLDNKVHNKPNTYLKRAMLRYLGMLLKGYVEVDVYVCQTCISKRFRKFRKGV